MCVINVNLRISFGKSSVSRPDQARRRVGGQNLSQLFLKVLMYLMIWCYQEGVVWTFGINENTITAKQRERKDTRADMNDLF